MVDRKGGWLFFLFSISFSSVPTPGINNEHSLTLPENLGKLSRVPSMNVSAPHICLCSSRGVRCLIMLEGLNGRRR